MLYAIKNLSSSKTEPVEPWKLNVVVPEYALENKDKFIKWCQKPTTENCHFSAAEGLDPLRRVSVDNPAVLLHGLIADYDSEVTPEMIRALIEKSPTEFVPNWGSMTFSKGGRLVWLFEEPIALSDPKVTKAFLKLVSRKLKLVKLLPGFDADAFYDASQYFEKGRDWQNLSNDRIPKNFVHQWMYEAGNKVRWISDNLSIPLETVAKEVERQFPKRWRGPFEEGARGVRFWDADADNETSAVVRASGMQCFTGDVGFVPWRTILGTVFVEKYEADKTGEIISDVFYDGQFYWRQDPSGVWLPTKKEDFRLRLRVKYGLSNFTGRKDTSSEVDKVTYAVQEQKSVTAALPFVHHPTGVIKRDGQKYLNISSIECMQPAKEVHEWGEKFPWLANLIENMFDPEEQTDYFMAWWKHFYENALKQKPQSGQACFIAGDPGVGKTLLSTAIVSKSVGGHVDASSYLLGEEKFTSHVVGSPIMSVDDTVPASDQRRHTRYSAMIKKIVANRYHTYEAKFQNAGQVTWLGRVIVTCNLDPESVRLLPNVELSLLEKISLFRCKKVEKDFPKAEEIERIIDEELPHLLAWLLEWEIPEYCIGKSRFGVRSYHEKHLFNAALQTSASFAFLELLTDFLSEYAKG
ncbi:MAG: primase-helicase family protein, partial [Candidatus Thorarchaeota archaeon]